MLSAVLYCCAFYARHIRCGRLSREEGDFIAETKSTQVNLIEGVCSTSVSVPPSLISLCMHGLQSLLKCRSSLRREPRHF